MEAIFVSGYRKGLGKCLHDLLVSNTDYQVFFIGRPANEYIDRKNIHYLIADFSDNKSNWLDGFNFNEYNFSDVTFICNAATIEPIGLLTEKAVTEIEKSMRVNFLAPMKLINKLKAVTNNLKIINITSGAAEKAVPTWLGYCPSKAAMKLFLDVLGYEEGVSVNHFDPGVMDTKMQADIREKSKKYSQLSGFVDAHSSGQLRRASVVAGEIIRLI